MNIGTFKISIDDGFVEYSYLLTPDTGELTSIDIVKEAFQKAMPGTWGSGHIRPITESEILQDKITELERELAAIAFVNNGYATFKDQSEKIKSLEAKVKRLEELEHRWHNDK